MTSSPETFRPAGTGRGDGGEGGGGEGGGGEGGGRPVDATSAQAINLPLRLLAEKLREVFWVWTEGAGLVYLSPAFEGIWGRPVGAVRSTAQWLETIHPQDRPHVRSAALEADRDDWEQEYRIVLPDGSIRWIHDRTFRICDDSGAVLHFAGIAADVTERKRHETMTALRIRQQQGIADLRNAALAGSTVDELLRRSAEVARTIFQVDFCFVAEYLHDRGVFIARAALGTPDDVVPPGEIPDGTRSESGYALLTNEPVIMDDLSCETRFSVSRAIRESGARSGITTPIPGRSASSPAYGTFSIFSRDPRQFTPDEVYFLRAAANVLATGISHRQAEEALRRAKEEAEVANSAKSSLISRMSHELRTPLNAILGFTQLMQLEAETERQKECVRHVLSAGQQLLLIVDDVLDIARLEVNPQGMMLDSVAVHEALTQAIAEARPRAAARQITIELLATAAADKAVLVNRARLKRVLDHLLVNAILYNFAGGRVTLACQDMPAARLRILVADTGPGIAPGDLGRLFIPFDRLGAERTGVPGAGLGLALCKNLLEAQDGQIGVESVVGQGTTFWIQLPLAPPNRGTPPLDPPAGDLPPGPPSAPPATSTKRREPVRRAGRRRPRRILHIEDNLSNRLLIERFLSRHPHWNLLTASSGTEGLKMAAEQRINLVLLDVCLPDLPGLQVLNALRSQPATRGVPVIVLSADASPATIAALRAAGAQDYLTKPIDCTRLAELLAQWA